MRNCLSMVRRRFTPKLENSLLCQFLKSDPVSTAHFLNHPLPTSQLHSCKPFQTNCTHASPPRPTLLMQTLSQTHSKKKQSLTKVDCPAGWEGIAQREPMVGLGGSYLQGACAHGAHERTYGSTHDWPFPGPYTIYSGVPH